MRLYTESDIRKMGRTKPRNFRAMDERLVRAMGYMVTGIYYRKKGSAIRALMRLPVPIQHALSKSYARRILREGVVR